MKLSEIADRLQAHIGNHTELVSTTLEIASITAESGVAIVQTAEPHGMIDGGYVSLAGIEVKTPIDSASNVGFTHTFTTSTPHDLTLPEGATGDTVALDGFNDALGFNGQDNVLVAVPNRRTFAVTNISNNITLTGNEVLLESGRIGVNGVYQAEVIDRVSFRITGSFPDGDLTPVNGRVSIIPNVQVAPNQERIADINDTDPSNIWLFVVPGEGVVSKSVNSRTDGLVDALGGSDPKTSMIENFTVRALIPSGAQLAAEEAIDIAMDVLQPAIVRCLHGFVPTSSFSCPDSKYGIVYAGHAMDGYDNGSLAWVYEFEAFVDILYEDGAAGDIDSAAFRDVSMSKTNTTRPMTATVDLDDEPL